MDQKIKQVIVMRTDLNMRKGKMCAQAAHASMKIFFDLMSTSIEEVSVFPVDNNFTHVIGQSTKTKVIYKRLMFSPDDPMLHWMEGLFAKIVVGAGSLEELLEIRRRAVIADLYVSIIEDSGATEFKDECPECVGVGIIDPYHNNLSCSTCGGTGKVNRPTITCLAIGPAYSEAVDKITGGLKLL